MEPSVSVPIAKAHSPAAVAEADPALDPLDPSLRFQGLRVRPPYQMSLYANAPTVVLPSSTAPAARSLRTSVASYSGTRSRYGSAPQPVTVPFVSNKSLSPYGIPCSGPRLTPARSSASAASASARARPWVTIAKHSSFGPRD